MKILIQIILNKFTIFFDRNWNLIFNKQKCVKFIYKDNLFRYNDIINDGKDNFRSLGKDWYILQKTLNRVTRHGK